MSQPPDPRNDPNGPLPATLDEQWLVRRAMESLEVFRNTPGFLDQWLLGLRDRYSTPWELDILKNAEQKLRQQIGIMKLSAEHAGVRRSLRDRAEAEELRGRKEKLDAQVQFDEAAERSKHSDRLARARVETELLEQEAKAAGFRATTREASQQHRPPRQSPSDRTRAEEAAAAAHATTLAREQAQKAKHEAERRTQRQSHSDAKTSAGPAPPPLTAAERRALLLTAEEKKVQALAAAETWMRKELDELQRTFGVDSEESRDREAYWNHRRITLRERDPVEFLGKEDQERLCG